MPLLLILIIIATIVVLSMFSSKFIIKDTFTNYKPKSNKFENPNIIHNLPNPPMDNYNKLEKKYYNLKEDCYWNNKCELPPNNHNFFEYHSKTTKTPSLLSCNIDTNKLLNCTNNQFDGCFINKTCSCQKVDQFKKDIVVKSCIEPFIAPAIDYSEGNAENILKYNQCPEGHSFSIKDRKCNQICRGCVVGFCKDAQCHS